MVSVGLNNMALTKYLISEVFQSDKSRMDSLREYFPAAKDEDWTLANAGQRVQIIKKDEDGKGKLEFGTEVITAADGTLAALLGASPGASTSVSAMLNIVETCFKEKMATPEWQAKIKEMIPSYGHDLTQDPERLKTIREYTLSTLGLDPEKNSSSPQVA